jgi:ribokinase
MNKRTVTVIGSYNVGLFFKGQQLPGIGETVIGDRFYEGGGGKGSNQAIAASKMGAKTRFIGRIGNDAYGCDALSLYKNFGICTEMIKVDSTIHTGISVIFIDKDGQNSIMVVGGANFLLSKQDIDSVLSSITDSYIVGFQLENSLEVVEYAIKKVHEMGIKTLLDPAPAMKLSESLYSNIYYLKPNEHEASVLSGIKVYDVASAEKAGKWFLKRGVNTAIITLGKQGTVMVNSERAQYFPTPDLKPIDTTGAGDCFSGALMSALSHGKEIEEAIVFANCASSISVTRLGVVDAIPDLCEVNELVRQFTGR